MTEIEVLDKVIPTMNHDTTTVITDQADEESGLLENVCVMGCRACRALKAWKKIREELLNLRKSL